jgi:hypothetical protein
MNDTDDIIKILLRHFEKVYNRDLSYDPEILKKLRKRDATQDFVQPPTRDEFRVAIEKMNSLAAPGKSGLSPAAMKNKSDEHKEELLSLSRDTGMEQIPTRSGTAQSSIGSTKEKEKAATQTTTEASASRM